MSHDEFTLCPNCGSDEIIDIGYDDDEPDAATVECDKCGWEGDESELVCKEEGL
jgi:predicted RNA-binding Zn-ribbon protein involved in translation (DUF1610 family)